MIIFFKFNNSTYDHYFVTDIPFYNHKSQIKRVINRPWFICPNGCGKRYTLRSTLSRHIRFECGVEPKFKCGYCPYRCKQLSNLNRHIVNVHKEKVSLT